MTYKQNVNELEEMIKYHFRNRNYLRQSITHSSYSNEKRMHLLANNERLEFLGDAVLEVIASEFIYVHYTEMDEGEMTKLRAGLVCEQSLATCAREIQLGTYLLLGKGENATGGRERDSILSDALEALIGAIYLDGGFTSAKEFVNQYVLNDIEHKKLFYDSKTILQEVVQSKFRETLKYQLIQEEGPDHNKKFTVAVSIGERNLGIGSGRTKKAAEQEAAYQAILILKQKED
ncbi:ribonuclease III [Anaeromicropila populeti]|uniref:Ribonuclease 3 n=1 Tax=Anaeromicropila populeti TaxID=37658 RepID=A0A1I6KG48_9FIRM|nr:ribonuclease III [Anaeromicropila populeti]SFR90166.1 RNAse III [Anaeromicropila populeti]